MTDKPNTTRKVTRRSEDNIVSEEVRATQFERFGAQMDTLLSQSKPKGRNNKQAETDTIPETVAADTPEAHWERFKAAARILATTSKPAKIPSVK